MREEIKREIERKLRIWKRGCRRIDYYELLKCFGIDARFDTYVAVRRYRIEDSRIEIEVMLYSVYRVAVSIVIDMETGAVKALYGVSTRCRSGDNEEVDLEPNDWSRIFSAIGLNDVYQILKAERFI